MRSRAAAVVVAKRSSDGKAQMMMEVPSTRLLMAA
jgi:hypothetical protein